MPRLPFVLLMLAALAPLQADVPAEARKARAVLEKHCYRCHGENGASEGGMNYVLDRGKLVAKGQVIAKQAAASPLYKRVSDGEMPADEKTKVSDDDLAALKDWIAAGAVDFNAAVGDRAALSHDQMIDRIAEDLNKPENLVRRPFLRYFTLTHLWNAKRTEDEMQTSRNALTKLINSLSWGRRVVLPVAVDRERTVFRIDLRDLQWTRTTWHRIVAANPFSLEPATPREKRVAEMVDSRIAHVRGDWFVAAASRPPLYHEVLQIPLNVSALETRLGVDAARNIANLRVARAGFNGSGVSQNNRLIERHESSFGAYWKSYDFSANSGAQNLFDRPLGPGADERRFLHDGGELIFNLPNGLQGYMLVDGKGRRIDKGPTAIVSDPARPDRAVENGISCMGCHSQGMIRKADQIREHATKNAGAFQRGELRTIQALYPGEAAIAKLFDEDFARYQRAIEECRIPLTKTDPIITLVKRFEEALDLDLVVAEAEMDAEAFRKLLQSQPNLTRQLGNVLLPGGVVQRDAFVQAYPELAAATQRTPYSPSFGIKPTTAKPAGIDDGMLLFSASALKDAQAAIDKLRTTKKLDIAVVTLANVPDADLAEFELRDDPGRLKLVGDISVRTLNQLKPKGLLWLVVKEGGRTRWSVRALNTKTVKNADLVRISTEVLPFIDKKQFDESLAHFVKQAEELLAKEP